MTAESGRNDPPLTHSSSSRLTVLVGQLAFTLTNNLSTVSGDPSLNNAHHVGGVWVGSGRRVNEGGAVGDSGGVAMAEKESSSQVGL